MVEELQTTISTTGSKKQVTWIVGMEMEQLTVLLALLAGAFTGTAFVHEAGESGRLRHARDVAVDDAYK